MSHLRGGIPLRHRFSIREAIKIALGDQVRVRRKLLLLPIHMMPFPHAIHIRATGEGEVV